MNSAIEINDMLGYRFPENLQYSPDGTRLGFQVAYADKEKNDYRRDVYLSCNNQVIQLTHTLDAALVCWQDQTHMILQRSTEKDEPGTTVLYTLNVNGGEAEPWIVLPFEMQTMTKVSDGVYAALGIIRREDPDAYLDSAEKRREKNEARAKEADYQVVDEVPYWFNGRNFINGQRTALFIIRTDKLLKIKRVTGPTFDVSAMKVSDHDVCYTGISWTGYSSMIYQKIFAYHMDSGRNEIIYGRADHTISGLFVIKNRLYCLATDTKQYGINESAKLYLVTKDGLVLKKDPERSLYNSAAVDMALGSGRSSAVSGNSFITLASDEDRSEIWKYNSSFEKEVLFSRPGAVFFLDVSDSRIAFAYMSPASLMEVYEMDHDGRNVRKITSLNEAVLKGKYIAKPNRIDYVSGNEKLHGWVLLPQKFSKNKKYPAILDIHGGPRTIYSEAFFHEMQVWCAKGYVVCFTNIRGSDGRGDAFADIRDQYGSVDFENLMDFTDAVLKKYPNINQKKLCETGGSYGGFMTNWIIGHTDRFCCAASQRSISNWISEAFMSDIGMPFSSDQCGVSSAFRDTEKFWNHSPLKYADRVKTPTLFIHSDQDRRCPLPEGMQMMQALSIRGIETRMVIFHGENHELSRSGKPEHRIRRLQEITDWFDRHTA
ncbi:MAG: S9 family peptidase [Erysipelotrichia bacterium]|nr:S9 family peptidase [Erysipelotrichia bacterium]